MNMPQSQRKVDVLVVGLGPGGGSAAWRAARAGLRVLGIDKKRQVGLPVQCAEFIPLPLGRHADSSVRVQNITGMKSYLPSGSVEKSDFPGLMIDRQAFDAAFSAKARSAGAELLVNTRLRSLRIDERVAVIETPAGMSEITYELLIAADGPHSPCARFLGWPEQLTVNTRQYTVPLKRAYSDTDIWLSDAYPGGYAWLFPKGKMANIGLGADKRFTHDLKKPLDELHEQLYRQGLVGGKILARTGGAIPVGGLRERLSDRNIVFVGDAAGLTHPITGAGISAAVISGERAGQAAVELMAGGQDALADYEEDIRDQFEHTLQRAVARRQWLSQHWRTPRAQKDEIQRRGWIAFEEYFGEPAA